MRRRRAKESCKMVLCVVEIQEKTDWEKKNNKSMSTIVVSKESSPMPLRFLTEEKNLL